MRFIKPRYSLAMMLIVVTATAVLLWGVPEWREFQRRMEFERAACQLTTGIEPYLFDILPRHASGDSLTSTVFSDANHNYVKAVPVFYKRYWYCIYAHTGKLTPEDEEELKHQQTQAREESEKVYRAGVAQGLSPAVARKKAFESAYATKLNRWRHSLGRWNKLYVYRLKPMPRGYTAQSKGGKQQVTRHRDMKTVDREPRDQYLTDFYEILSGRETRDLGIKYELIHADPPVPGK
jgi:hypothetical protein